MELRAAIRLIQNGIDRNTPQRWADLGAGGGLFTRALAEILPDGSVVEAVDKDATVLRNIKSKRRHVTIETRAADFTTKAELKEDYYDGILIANSLHFVEDQDQFLKQLGNKLKAKGRLLIIEYDMSVSNPWITWPISFEDLKVLASKTGFTEPMKLAEHPSMYNRSSIYSALLLLP